MNRNHQTGRGSGGRPPGQHSLNTPQEAGR